MAATVPAVSRRDRVSNSSHGGNPSRTSASRLRLPVRIVVKYPAVCTRISCGTEAGATMWIRTLGHSVRTICSARQNLSMGNGCFSGSGYV